MSSVSRVSPVPAISKTEHTYDAVTQAAKDSTGYSDRNQFFTDLAKTLEKTAKNSASSTDGFRQDLVDLGRKNLNDARVKRRQWKKEAIEALERAEKNISKKEEDFKEHLKKLKAQEETKAAQAESAEKSSQITDKGTTKAGRPTGDESHKSNTFMLNIFLIIRAAISNLISK